MFDILSDKQCDNILIVMSIFCMIVSVLIVASYTIIFIFAAIYYEIVLVLHVINSIINLF